MKNVDCLDVCMRILLFVRHKNKWMSNEKEWTFCVEFRLKALRCVTNKRIQFCIVTEQEQKLTHERRDNSIRNNKKIGIGSKRSVELNEPMLLQCTLQWKYSRRVYFKQNSSPSFKQGNELKLNWNKFVWLLEFQMATCYM